MEGASNQQSNTTLETKTNKLDSLQTTNNSKSNEQSFNTLNNSMLINLKVSIHSLDNCNSCSNHEHYQTKPDPIKTNQVDVLEIVRRKAEINAAIVSLKTNLVLGASVIFIFICFFLTSRALNTILVTLLKGLIPIATAILNFVKIQEVYKLYWNKFKPCLFV